MSLGLIERCHTLSQIAAIRGVAEISTDWVHISSANRESQVCYNLLHIFVLIGAKGIHFRVSDTSMF